MVLILSVTFAELLGSGDVNTPTPLVKWRVGNKHRHKHLNYIQQASFSFHPLIPLTMLWSIRCYSRRHFLQVLPYCRIEPGTMWLNSKFLTTQSHHHLLQQANTFPSNFCQILNIIHHKKQRYQFPYTSFLLLFPLLCSSLSLSLFPPL